MHDTAPLPMKILNAYEKTYSWEKLFLSNKIGQGEKFAILQWPFAGVNISTEKRKLFPDNLLKTRNFSHGNCHLLKGTPIIEVTFGVFLNPFPTPPL